MAANVAGSAGVTPKSIDRIERAAAMAATPPIRPSPAALSFALSVSHSNHVGAARSERHAHASSRVPLRDRRRSMPRKPGRGEQHADAPKIVISSMLNRRSARKAFLISASTVVVLVANCSGSTRRAARFSREDDRGLPETRATNVIHRMNGSVRCMKRHIRGRLLVLSRPCDRFVVDDADKRHPLRAGRLVMPT